MLSSERLGPLARVIALATALLCAAAILIGVLLHSRSEKQKEHAEYQEKAQTQRELTRDQIVVACGSLDGAALSNCLDKEVEAHDVKQASNEDLKAQQDMALWGLWMVIVAAFSAIISAFAVWLLYLTLREAAQTTRTAMIAASHAEKGNVILRKGHRAANPPRFHVKQIRLDLEEWVEPNGRHGELWIFNTGLNQLKMRISCIVFHTGKHPPPTNPWQVNRIANRLHINGKTVVKDDVFDLREGCWWPFVGDGCTVAPDRIRDALTGKGGMRFFVMGRIHYWDIDNTHRHVVFCRAYDPNSKRFVTLDDTDYEYQT